MSYNHLTLENAFPLALEKEFKYLNWLYTYLVLPFNIQAQTQSNWCWAATATSVSHFYSFLSPWTQCKVASAELAKECCTTPVPGACNVPWYLDKALTRTNNFFNMQSGTAPWNTVKSELEKGLVVGARVGWNGGGGHFMVLHGVSASIFSTTKFLHIDDPIYAKSTLTYDQFATNYQGSGTWTHTYFTKKYFYFMWFKPLAFNPVLLKPIPEIRPLLAAYDEHIDLETLSRESDFGIPHFVFNLPLNMLSKEAALPRSPIALRVLQMKKDAPVAYYDLGLDEQNPTLLQMNTSQPFFVLMDGALGKLKSVSKERKTPGELRLLKVPALNLEALWLAYTGDTQGQFAILPRFQYELFDNDKVYEEAEFLKLLSKAAAKVKQDDTMGA
jgi:papain like cysteine protease AvrRpt2